MIRSLVTAADVRKSNFVLALAVRSIRSSTGRSTRRYARLQKKLTVIAFVLVLRKVLRKALHQKDSMLVPASRRKNVTCLCCARDVKLGFGCCSAEICVRKAGGRGRVLHDIGIPRNP
jgi:hypothetical protein